MIHFLLLEVHLVCSCSVPNSWWRHGDVVMSLGVEVEVEVKVMIVKQGCESNSLKIPIQFHHMR